MAAAVPSSREKAIFKILRDCCDAPRILFRCEDTLQFREGGDVREVIILSTKYFTYMIRDKPCKLYARWANRFLRVAAQGDKVSLSSLDPRAIQGTQLSYKESTDAAVNEFSTVTLDTHSALEAGLVEEKISYLVQSAQRTARLLESEERGVTGGKAASPTAEAPDGAGGGSSDSDSEDGEGGPGETLNLAAAARASGIQREGGKRKAPGLLEMAPSRYISITSLVDGEFADYTTLRNAYMRKEEEDLLRDLGTFIKENEGQVEALCEYHRPAFIHAAQQCVSISEKDAQLVGQELSGADALVRAAVINMKKVASNLVLSRSTRDNLQSVRGLLVRAIAVAEYLETAESQTKKQQLLSAVTSLRELVRLAAPLGEYAIGEYVLQVRVPALTQDVFTYAVQHLNAWLRVLRDKAAPIGAAALNWTGVVMTGRVSTQVVMAANGDTWWLAERYEEAVLHLVPFEEADSITEVANGAGVQVVFVELRRAEYMNKYYAEGRAQQVKADLLEVVIQTEGVGPEVLLGKLSDCCATAIGFMLIEDTVYSATSPHIHSKAEIIRMWGILSARLAELATTVLRALLADPSRAPFAVKLFALLQKTIKCAADNMKSVELNTLALSRVMEMVSDQLISSWLQDACIASMQLIMADSFTPLVVNSAEEFQTNVALFHLHRCPCLELNIPGTYTSGVAILPYSSLAPAVGGQVLRFLEECYSATVTDTSAAVMQSESNNSDEMLLKYIMVLFRTVAESLQGQLMSIGKRSVLQLAVYVTTCSVMPVIVSCVEQQYLLHWQGAFEHKSVQVLGSPQIMADCAKFFSKPLQSGIERLMEAYMGELEDRLKPMQKFGYWKSQVENRRQTKKADAATLASCMEYALNLVPKISEVLQTAVVRSVVGSAFTQTGILMSGCMESAITAAWQDGERDFTMMRDCISEFEQQCTVGVPMWQRRLQELLPGLGVAQRMPLDYVGACNDVRTWLAKQEAQYLVDKANQPQILAGIEGAGKAMAKGFQAVGKTMTATANVFKKDQQ